MSDDLTFCTACGRRIETDDHHIGGEAYDDTTTPICTDGCHGFLSRCQQNNGVDLSKGEPKSEVDSVRARALGFNDLLSLSVRRRHPQLIPMVELFDRSMGIASALLDLSDDPDRPGRWLPDTIGTRHRGPWRVPPIDLPEGADLSVVGQMAGAVAVLGDDLVADEEERSAIARFADDPEGLFNKVEATLALPEVQEAWVDLMTHMESVAQQLFEFLVVAFDAISTGCFDDLDLQVERSASLAPVFHAMESFFRDAEQADTDGEVRDLLLRLPKAVTAVR